MDDLLRSPRFVVVLALVAAGLAVLSEVVVYPGYSWNRDEPVYLWQTGLLHNGQLTSTDGGFPEVLHPWLSGHRDGVFFSQYPLGWPLALLVGQVLGWPGFTLAASCALAVVGSYALAHEVTRDRRIAALGASLLLVSPIVAIQSGVYLTYLFSVGLGTLFATFFLAGIRRGSRRRVALSGALLGWIVITRSYDAVVWAVVVGGFVLVTERHRWRAHLRLVPSFLATVLPFVVLQLAHNRYLTGDPFEFPITVADPLDRFGFGERRLMPGLDPVQYGERAAVRSSLKNAFFVPWFLVGAYVGAAVAVFGAVRHVKQRSTWLLLAICVGFPIGYFPFWGMHVSSLTTRLSGPIYYIPVYVPLCILMAQGFVHGLRRFPRATAVVAAAVVVVTVPVGLGRVGLNRHLSRIQLVWAESTDEIEGRALVVVSPSRYLMYLNPDARNDVDLDEDILYATDAGPSLIELIEQHPDRRALMQRALVPTADLLPSEGTDPYDVELVPLEIVRGDALEVTVRVVAPRDGAVSVALTMGSEVVWRDLADDAEKGEVIETSWLLGSDRSVVGADGVTVPAGGSTVEVLAGFGSTAARARAEPSVKYQLLVQSGPTMRALQPGTFYRPDPEAPDDGIYWRDDKARSDLQVSVAARPSS